MVKCISNNLRGHDSENTCLVEDNVKVGLQRNIKVYSILLVKYYLGKMKRNKNNKLKQLRFFFQEANFFNVNKRDKISKKNQIATKIVYMNVKS